MSSVEVYIMAHGAWFADAPSHAPFRPVDLETLPLPSGIPHQRWLSETALFLTDVLLEARSDYVWIASGRHDQKWVERGGRSTRLLDLPRFLSTDCIWCTCIGRRQEWPLDDELEHPGMATLVREIFESFNLQDRHDTVYANSLCFRRDMLPRFLSMFKQMFDHFHAKYGTDLPFNVGSYDESRKGSYFYERVCMAILADWPDLSLCQIP